MRLIKQFLWVPLRLRQFSDLVHVVRPISNLEEIKVCKVIYYEMIPISREEAEKHSGLLVMKSHDRKRFIADDYAYDHTRPDNDNNYYYIDDEYSLDRKKSSQLDDLADDIDDIIDSLSKKRREKLNGKAKEEIIEESEQIIDKFDFEAQDERMRAKFDAEIAEHERLCRESDFSVVSGGSSRYDDHGGDEYGGGDSSYGDDD